MDFRVPGFMCSWFFKFLVNLVMYMLRNMVQGSHCKVAWLLSMIDSFTAALHIPNGRLLWGMRHSLDVVRVGAWNSLRWLKSLWAPKRGSKFYAWATKKLIFSTDSHITTRLRWGYTRVQIFQRPEKRGVEVEEHRESTPWAWLDYQFQQPSKPTKNANKWARMIHSVAALDKHVRLRQTKHRCVHFLEIKKIILSSFISLPWFVDKSSLVWAMAWCRTGDKPLPKQMMKKITDRLFASLEATS